jgi:hypothetical protein
MNILIKMAKRARLSECQIRVAGALTRAIKKDALKKPIERIALISKKLRSLMPLFKNRGEVAQHIAARTLKTSPSIIVINPRSRK